MIGNKATGSLLKSGTGTIQTKLNVTAADDSYEREADTVAEQVVSQNSGESTQRQAMEEEEEVAQAKRIQRQGEEEEEVAQAKRIQRLDNVDMSGAFDVGGKIEDQIRDASGGQSLDNNMQDEMGSAIGADFSSVQVHTDASSNKLARSLGARAFTYGNDVFFGEGEYNPQSSDGKHLLAHELTHTVQQGSSPATQAKRDDD
jgi:hypothetical protein